MSIERDPETILATWLEEGPLRLPETTRRAIAVNARTTNQTRLPWWMPQRRLFMNPMARFAIVAVAVLVLVGGAVYVFGPGQGGIGGQPSAAPLPTASPTARPSATPDASPSAIASPKVFDSDPAFDPPIRLSLVDGWTAFGDPNPAGIVNLLRLPIDDAGIMSIAKLTVRGPTLGAPMVPWPDDIHAWLAGRPEFRPSEPRETTIGGRPGFIIDSDVVVGPKTDVGDWLKYGPGGWNLAGADGSKMRLVVVNTGAHAGIVALIGGSPATFDANTAALDRLLATLEFR